MPRVGASSRCWTRSTPAEEERDVRALARGELTRAHIAAAQADTHCFISGIEASILAQRAAASSAGPLTGDAKTSADATAKYWRKGFTCSGPCNPGYVVVGKVRWDHVEKQPLLLAYDLSGELLEFLLASAEE